MFNSDSRPTIHREIPITLALSARIALALRKQSNDGMQDNQSERQRDRVRTDIARYMVILARWAISGKKPAEEFSPIPLHAAYHSAVAYLEIYHNNQQEYLAGIENTKGMLRMYNGRWKIGRKSRGIRSQQNLMITC